MRSTCLLTHEVIPKKLDDLTASSHQTQPTQTRTSSQSTNPPTQTQKNTTKMPAYNSIFNSDPDIRLIGNFPLLPLRTRTRGPAYVLPTPSTPLAASESPSPDDESYDSLDEILSLFRANTFFRNFEIQGPADRLLIYGILFVSEVLGKVRGECFLFFFSFG